MKKTKNKQVVVAPTTLKFKITNLRTVAFPGPLLESDYLGLKVGDYVARGSGGTIYEVTFLSREAITNYDQIHKKLHTYGNCSDRKVLNLIESYKNNGNFGVCSIMIVPVIRGGKLVNKGKPLSFNEINQGPIMDYKGFSKVDLQTIIKAKEYYINKFSAQIARLEIKKNAQTKIRNTILSLITNKANTTLINSTIEVSKAIDNFIVEAKEASKCQKCGGEGTTELHSCPYQCDINDDDSENCNCCSDCEHECAMDI